MPITMSIILMAFSLFLALASTHAALLGARQTSMVRAVAHAYGYLLIQLLYAGFGTAMLMGVSVRISMYPDAWLWVAVLGALVLVALLSRERFREIADKLDEILGGERPPAKINFRLPAGHYRPAGLPAADDAGYYRPR